MAELLILPKTRLKWHQLMCEDCGLSHLEFRIACFLGKHFDNVTGECFVARQTIAHSLGIKSLRTVTTALSNIEHRGHLEILRLQIGTRGDGSPVYGGSGNANAYRFPFERVQQVALLPTEREQ